MIGRKRTTLCCLFLMGLLGLYGCSSPSSDSAEDRLTESESQMTLSEQAENTKESCNGLVYESSMELQYADNFSVDYYEGGYTLLTVMDGTRILVVPEGKDIPEGLDEEIQVVQRPIQNLYLVASAAMDMFDALDALDTIRLSGQKEENWYVESAREAMEKGEILYAGKYDKPDYELIVSENCSLVIENTMISHSPEVIEMFEDFGIPVMIEYSSYESHPLGRVEWIKFYGALVGKEDEAEKAFADQITILEEVTADEKTEQTVAFFFITSNGLVQVRQSSDYVPKMIELAGGKYIFENLGNPESNRSTMNMQIEEFYDRAKDADYIIYNSSIDGGVVSIEELIEKCGALEDFKAVQEGNVWCTTNDMYQQSMSVGYFIKDIHAMLQGEEETEMNYLFHLE
ncbi:MAG: ABC transporter substrate-binding protein [Roseburia sp.]